MSASAAASSRYERRTAELTWVTSWVASEAARRSPSTAHKRLRSQGCATGRTISDRAGDCGGPSRYALHGTALGPVAHLQWPHSRTRTPWTWQAPRPTSWVEQLQCSQKLNENGKKILERMVERSIQGEEVSDTMVRTCTRGTLPVYSVTIL